MMSMPFDNARPLLRACHLQPTLAVTAITTALALSAGRGVSSVWVALAVVSGQLTVGWTNDYFDRDRDRQAGRVDKPIVAGQVSAGVVLGSATIVMMLCVPLSFASGTAAATVHLSAVAAALTYNAGLKSTVASAVPYAYAFGALPAFVTLGLTPSHMPPVWAIAAGALMGVGAHFVNTLPDRAGDKQAGVLGLPQRLPATFSLVTGVALLSAAALLVALAPAGKPGATSLSFAAAALGSSAAVLGAILVGRHRLAWSLTIAVAGLTVSGFIASGSTL
jgi:4-hydroxybenzoate polyprenyltransferase